MIDLKKIVMVCSLLSPSLALSAEQIITPIPASENVIAGQPVSVQVDYSTANPLDNTLAGLGLRIHWDSTKLTLIDLSNQLSAGLQPAGVPEADSSDFDSDPTTDTFVVVPWIYVGGQWPGAQVTLPVELYTAHFMVAASIVPGTTTTVNFSASSTASGYTLQSTSATKTVLAR